MSINERLRLIEEKMADPSKTPKEIEDLLNIYYELLDLNNNNSSLKRR